ncbi:MAG: TM2 domain-containing protein [Pseudomonadota bacterium]
MNTTTTNSSTDPDFALEVVADLYRPRPRQLWTAMALALLTGIFGGHRFYCGRPWTAIAMLLTAGGAVVWLVWDIAHLRQLVSDCNEEERRRQAEGLPPRGMEFMPPRAELQLNEAPHWASRRSGRGRIIGSTLLLALIGFTLGAVSGAAEAFEPVVVLALFIAASLLSARWHAMAEIPVLNALARWVHRLRLYYHVTDPGPLWSLATRPIIGIVLAPWRPKVRAEVRLYLQFGIIIGMVLSISDVIELLQSGSFWAGFAMLIAEFVQNLIYTYLFVAPAGALLTTQLLLTRRDHLVWLLSALTLLMIYLGVSTVSN